MTALNGTVLLTGATGGIGEAIARALAARGASLVLTGRRTDVLESLARELAARTIVADLADRDAPAALAAEAGPIDILVANAALPASGRFLAFSPGEIDRALDVNLRAPLQLARALAPGMVERHHGHLVLISSLSGKVAAGGSSLYSATKFGLRGFSLGLREDLRGAGVGVSTVFPGFVRDAGMFHDSGVRLGRGVGTRTPDEVAAAVVSAIERNRAEVDVAPLTLRLGAALAGLVPELALRASGRAGRKVADDIAAGQADKR